MPRPGGRALASRDSESAGLYHRAAVPFPEPVSRPGLSVSRLNTDGPSTVTVT